MDRRDMMFETFMALVVVTAVVFGNFLLQRWWTGGQTAREATAAADSIITANKPLETDRTQEAAPVDISDIPPPRPARSRRVPTVAPKRKFDQLTQLIKELMPDSTSEERESWHKQLRDVSLEDAAGILELRQQVGSLNDQ